MERKKALGFWDLALFVFCSIFGLEAISASAAIGPSALSWWLIGITCYFLPSGLISAELGSAYPEQGGMYVWIKRAFGKKWAARSIWYYWVSLPIWLPAIYIAIAEIFGHIFFPGISLWRQIAIGTAFIWVAVGINLCPLKVSKWIPNIGSIAQSVVIVGMICAAIAYFRGSGHFANDIAVANILPNLGAAIVFIPVIIYNILGCELVSSAAGEMKDPTRDIPRALIFSAIVIAFLYLITTFAVLVVIPVNEINISSGILQLFMIALEGNAMRNIVILAAGLLISVALFSGIVAWTLGQNRAVAESANNGELPRVLGRTNKQMAPVGASVVSGIISTAVLIVYGFIAKNAAELFWHTVSFSLIVQLLSYLMLFPAFVILRRRDKGIPRPYRVPGPEWFAVFLAGMAEIFVLSAMIVLIIQPGHDFARSSLPIIIGVLVSVAAGEYLVANSTSKHGRI